MSNEINSKFGIQFNNDSPNDIFLRAWDRNMPPDSQGNDALLFDWMRINKNRSYITKSERDSDSNIWIKWEAKDTQTGDLYSGESRGGYEKTTIYVKKP